MLCNRLSHAFSLVELLVVISVITVIISLLMPSLQAAREVSYRVKCAANLRACAIAGLNYATDNRMYGPPHSYSTSQFTWTQGTVGTTTGPDGTPVTLKGLDSYFGYTSANADKTKFYFGVKGCPTYFKPAGSTAMQNYAFTANHFVLGMPTLSVVTYNRWFRLDSAQLIPSRTILFLDSNTDQFQSLSYVRQRTLPANAVSFGQRHNNVGLNFSFIDGHAQFLVCRDFTAGAAAPFEGDPILNP